MHVFSEFYRALPRTPLGGLTVPPRPPAGLDLGRPTLFYLVTALQFHVPVSQIFWKGMSTTNSTWHFPTAGFSCATVHKVQVLSPEASTTWMSLLNKIRWWRSSPQASYDKRRHRNCSQTRPLHAHMYKHFEKSKHLLGSEVSWCDHRLAQTPKEAFSEVRVHPGTTQVDFEVDRPPPADSPPEDLLITMVKETGIIAP